MTRKERMFAAMRHEAVDRVPHATYNLHPYANSHHVDDPSYAELLGKVRASAGVAAKVGFRGLGVALSREPEGVREVLVEGSGDEQITRTTLHTPKGDLTAVMRTPENKPGMAVKYFVTTDEELDRYLSLPYNPPEHDVANQRAFIETAGEGGVLMVTYSEPMYPTATLFGFEDFSIRCVTDMRTVKRVVDWHFERCAENVRRLTEACKGMACVLHTGGPEVCTPPMLGPHYFAELVTPYMRRLIDIIHDAGLLAGIHCHGRVREVFPEMIKMGADLLEPIEPPDQGNITLAELMGQAEGRICLMGHIQDQEFYTARPGEMTKRVEQIARVVDGRTGYIMSPTCTPFEHPCSDVYRRNYMEWLEAAAERL